MHNSIKKKFGFKYRESNLPWNAPSGTREQLAELFKELGFKEGAEIGVRRGAYSMVLCRKNPDLHLYAIDPWSSYKARPNQAKQERSYQVCVKNLSKYNATILRKASMDALTDIPDRSLDFVFIDGNHEFDYVAMDIICWAKKVRIGGIIAVHDYIPFHWAGVVEAVNAYTYCHHIDPWYITREANPTAFWVNR